MPTAILIDGGFFLRRFPSCYPNKDKTDPKVVAKTAFETALSHLEEKSLHRTVRHELYRIFFYDCPPLMKKAHYPKSRTAIDFSKTPQSAFRLALHDELRKQRKVALRLGHLLEHAEWRLRDGRLKQLLDGSLDFRNLVDDDFEYATTQKGVDMRIGLDIASLSFKRQVDQIVLVAGDADFVPAAKLARREGIDFILDPLWSVVHPSLYEHVDGVRSTCPNPLVAARQLPATPRNGWAEASKKIAAAGDDALI
ncbi:MAG: NYN domain-containing protein [Terracidiphilus sp.]